MLKLLLKIAVGSALGVVGGVLAIVVIESVLNQEKEKDSSIKGDGRIDNHRDGGIVGGGRIELIPNNNSAIIESGAVSPWLNNVDYLEVIEPPSGYIGEYGVKGAPVICIFDTNFLIDNYEDDDFKDLLEYIDPNTQKIVPNTVMAELNCMKKDSDEKCSNLAFKVRHVNELLSKIPKGASTADKTSSRKKGDDGILESIKYVAKQHKDFQVYVFTGDKLFTAKINQENIANVEVASSIMGRKFYF
ncbi:MAG: PIN domain-containing protein [Brevinema sp.]